MVLSMLRRAIGRSRVIEMADLGLIHGQDGLRHRIRRTHNGGEFTSLCGRREKPLVSTNRELCQACQRQYELEAHE